MFYWGGLTGDGGGLGPNLFGSLRCLCCGVSTDCTLVRNVLCHGSCSLQHQMAKSENHLQEKLAAGQKRVADLENWFHASKEEQAVKMASLKMVMIVHHASTCIIYVCMSYVFVCPSGPSMFALHVTKWWFDYFVAGRGYKEWKSAASNRRSRDNDIESGQAHPESDSWSGAH